MSRLYDDIQPNKNKIEVEIKQKIVMAWIFPVFPPIIRGTTRKKKTRQPYPKRNKKKEREISIVVI